MPAPVSPTLWNALDRARAALERAPDALPPRTPVRFRLVGARAAPPETPLDALLGFLAAHPDRLVQSSDGLRLRHAHCVPALAAALSEHSEAVALWYRLRDTPAAHVAARLCHPGWSAATRLHALWFVGAFAPPPASWMLDGARRVHDVARYRASVAERLAAGPDVAGACGVADELALLFARYGAPASAALSGRDLPARSAGSLGRAA
ncbi:MAG: hypothetical protein ACK41D_05240 [Rubricoccaceae bacterium]